MTAAIKCPIKYCTYETREGEFIYDHLVYYHTVERIAEALAKMLEKKEEGA